MNLSLIDPYVLAQDYPDTLTESLNSGHTVCLSFDRQGRFLASGRADGVISIFDLETSGIARKLKGHARAIHTLSWSRDGRYLLSSSGDWKCILWDLKDGSRAHIVRFHAAVYMAELHPMNHELFVATLIEDHPLLVNLATGEKSTLKSAPKRDGDESKADAKVATNAAIFSPAGKRIISGTSNGWINILDTETKEIVHSVRPFNSTIWSIRLAPSGTVLVVNSSDSILRTVRLPNLDSDTLDIEKISVEVEHKFQDLVNKTSWNHVTFSTTGDFVAATKSMATDIYVWERDLGSLNKILEGPKEELRIVEWHPQRPLVVASGMETGSIYVWSLLIPQRWSALAPDFSEVEENVEYLEREDEFDIHPIEEIHKRTLDLEDEEVDVLTIGPEEEDTFQMPVLYDMNFNDSEEEEEMIAVGPGTLRRKSPSARDWLLGDSDEEKRKPKAKSTSKSKRKK